MLEGRPALALQDTSEDMAYFLKALYGYVVAAIPLQPDSQCSMSSHAFGLEGVDFTVVSALLRLSTKYGVKDLRQEALRILLLSWPTTLALWEVREKKVTSIHGIYAPRTGLPHPL